VAATPGGRAPRLPELESLRGFAATSILVFHCWLFTSAAVLTWNLGPVTVFMQPLQSGVTLFFVLSGFLLYRPFAAALLAVEPNGVRIRSYLRNRALRILPAYVFVLLITGFVLRSAVTRGGDSGVSVGALSDGRTLISDLLLVQTYQPSEIWSGILPAWSLSVEVAFYALLPFLAYGAGKLLARGWTSRLFAALAPVALMLALGFIGKAGAAAWAGSGRISGNSWHAVIDRSLLTHADLFGFGMAAGLIYVIWQEREAGAPHFVGGGVVGRVLAYLGVPTLVLGFYFLPAYVYDSLVAFFCALLLLRVTAAGRAGAPKRVLHHPWSLACGRLSYSVFLWNFPVLIFFRAQGLLSPDHGALAFVFNLALTVTAVGILSFVTYRFIEVPALRWKQRHLVRPVPIPTMAQGS
jgi:peptidoglycan/LPS O-acetylase OafA/YrhL